MPFIIKLHCKFVIENRLGFFERSTLFFRLTAAFVVSHSLKRKYVEGETISESGQLNSWFERVFADPGATLRKRPNENSRYVLHSETLQLTAIMDKNGQRVTVFNDDGNKLEPVWLSLDELIKQIR
jgi:hypothetical protein